MFLIQSSHTILNIKLKDFEGPQIKRPDKANLETQV